MKEYFLRTTSAVPLAIFRIVLGSLMCVSIIRFWMNGWIESLYIQPSYFFSYYGFEFVKPLGNYTYVLFAVCAVAALLVAVGLFYRVAIVILFASFTYIELMDKSTYLNHYYFISMICLLMICLPAHAQLSVDAYRNEKNAAPRIPLWCTDSIKLFACLVYVFAGLAKINSDWLLHAMPLRIWLPAKNDLPLVGFLFDKVWIAFLLSWAGCLYDLCIPFLLLSRHTRPFAFIMVVIFHGITTVLFPIGMFPYVMIGTALIFFSPEFYETLFSKLRTILKFSQPISTSGSIYTFAPVAKRLTLIFFAVFFFVQVIMPLRFLAYPDQLFWNEEGYRFSWRVMLMEKAGYAQFTVKDSDNKHIIVNNNDFLTPLQEKMMSAQPDMILQYAHYLRDHYQQHGFKSPEVYVDSYVTVNGRMGRPMIRPETDLAKEEDSFLHKPWIVPLDHDSKGL